MQWAGITIRRATPADLDVVTSNNVEACQEATGKTIDPSVVRRSVAETLSCDGDFYLVALIDGEIAGQLRIARCDSDWYGRERWIVECIFTRNEYRGRGVARSLLATLDEFARQSGIEYCLLWVNRLNIVAKTVYNRSGFSSVDSMDLMVKWATN